MIKLPDILEMLRITIKKEVGFIFDECNSKTVSFFKQFANENYYCLTLS